MSFNIPQNTFSNIDKTTGNSIFQPSQQTSSADSEPIFDIGNIMAEKMSSLQDDMQEANEFNVLTEECSDTKIRYINRHMGNFPPLKKGEHYSELWQTSPTTFEVVRGEIEGGHPYRDLYEFDSTPACVEDKDGNFIYSGTISGSDVEITTKDGKVVDIKLYSDDDELSGIITYDQNTGEKNTIEYQKDGKSIKYRAVNRLNGTSDVSEYYESGKLKSEGHYDYQSNSDYSEYYENGQLSKRHCRNSNGESTLTYLEDGRLYYKDYVNSDGVRTLFESHSSNGIFSGLFLNGGEVDLDMSEFSKTSTQDGDEYTSPDGKTVVVLNKDGGYSVTIDGEEKRYNEKGEPIKE